MALNRFLKQGDKIWVHHSGRTFLIDSATNSTQTTKSKSRSESGLMESPMPGKILKMNIKKGDAVKDGQTVCVIEAMKMEYALKAPFNGKVKEVYKTDNQLVTLGEKILEIEKI